MQFSNHPRVIRLRRWRSTLLLSGAAIALIAVALHSTPVMLAACSLFLAGVLVRFREANIVIDLMLAQFDAETAAEAVEPETAQRVL